MSPAAIRSAPITSEEMLLPAGMRAAPAARKMIARPATRRPRARARSVNRDWTPVAINRSAPPTTGAVNRFLTLGEHLLHAARGLTQPLFVFDQRDSDESFAFFPESRWSKTNSGCVR